MQSTPDDLRSKSSYSQDEDLSQVQGRQQKKNHRPRMSCHQCRLRKIRCDRVYPCTACCSRGKPKDCVYPVDANNKAIDQSQEIKALRKQVHDLQGEISKLRSSSSENVPQYSYSQSVDASNPGRSGPKFPAAQSRPPFYDKAPTDPWQRPAYNTPPSESMRNFSDMEYFSGSDQPSNKNEPRVPSLAYTEPRDVDEYAYQDADADPFPSLWQASLGVGELLHVLPSQEDMLAYLEAFQHYIHGYSFYRMSNDDFRDFLADVPGNAEKSPQMLAFLFAILAHGVRFSVFVKHGRWVQGAMENEIVKADLYIAASMHALRLSSFMNRPTLLSVQTLLIMGLYLINMGKFLESYTIFGITIRVSQALGLYQDPGKIFPRPCDSECDMRKDTWQKMLLQDHYYSIILGRPLGISFVGNIGWIPSNILENSDRAFTSRLEAYVTKLTSMGRDILSRSHLTNSDIDHFTDSLLHVLQDIPEEGFGFNKSWLCADTAIPEWPSNMHAAMLHSYIHGYIILLNRRRQDSRHLKGSSGIQARSERMQEKGYCHVISSCHEVLSTFSLLHQRIPIGLAYWEVGQQAFNAAMILGLNILETRDFTDLRAMVSARDIFEEMKVKHICRAANLAVPRLDALLELINGKSTNFGREKVMSNHGMILAEDPEIRGTSAKPYAPLTLRFDDDVQTRPNVDGSHVHYAPANARYSGVDQKKQVKRERNDRVQGFGNTPGHRYKSPSGRMNEFPAEASYSTELKTGLPFPSTIAGRHGDKRPYNTGVDDSLKAVSMDTWPSSTPPVCTRENQYAYANVYTSAGTEHHHQ